MQKSYSKDIQILVGITRNRQKIINAMNEFKCDFSYSKKGITNNEMAFDLCAMYMAQIGESAKLLTDNSKCVINSIVDVNTLKYFRNMIDHSYEKVNRDYLQAYIVVVVSDKFLEVLKNQIRICINNKRKSN